MLAKISSIVRAALAAVVGTGLVVTAAATPAVAAAPRPVYAPTDHSVADPGIVLAGGDFHAFTTGFRAPVLRGDYATGPWHELGAALSSPGDWAESGAIWAPDAVKTPAGWVLYYSAPGKGLNGQRCIGTAVAADVDGPYQPAASPLICPGGALGADDRVPGRPVADAGVIDPSPFVTDDGRRFVLYKTQQTPSSLRMLRVNADGTRWIGNDSGELIRNNGIIENPVMVQRGASFVLFASRYGYNNCSYSSVWYRSGKLWDFAGKTEHSLLTTAGTGICGPGGADITPALDGGTRIFLHGWVCGTGTSPCLQSNYPWPNARRALYAAVLHWGTDGATPSVGAFLAP